VTTASQKHSMQLTTQLDLFATPPWWRWSCRCRAPTMAGWARRRAARAGRSRAGRLRLCVGRGREGDRVKGVKGITRFANPAALFLPCVSCRWKWASKEGWRGGV
jgi:hypothetical protein